jgi:hypothetical protein
MTYNIERNDIGGLIYSVNSTKPYDLVLFDTVSGGAGHVKRLKDDKSLLEVLLNALKKVSQNCCEEDTSCYNCLRTYNNQRLHNHIKRGLAKSTLTSIIRKTQEKNIQYSLSSPQLDFSTVDPNSVLDYGLITDDVTKEALLRLYSELERQKAAMPSGFGYTLRADDGSGTEYADFAWVENNVLLFTIDRRSSYDNLVNSQKRFKCFLLTESFDYVGFVTEVIE